MNYSISDLEQLSGVQTHTIRIWERRYNALAPLRSAGNTRYYTDNHLRKLLNIVSLSSTGLKISQVCALADEDVERLLTLELENTRGSDPGFEFCISQVLAHGLAYNETGVNATISKSISNYGMIETYKSIIYPLVVRLGLMWRMDHICPAQEHFLSNIIRQKLYASINDLPVNSETDAPCWLLFLPEDEDHDIGLLFANYILRLRGQRVVYLGAKVPVDSAKDAFVKNNVHHIMLFMVRWRPLGDAKNYLNKLTEEFIDINIHIAGNAKIIEGIDLPGNISWFNNIEEFEKILENAQHVA